MNPTSLPVESARAPGIYTGIPNDEYHSGPGVSKSGLWTIYNQTPAHFRFPPEKKETAQSQAIKDLGSAIHAAILEPDLFERDFIRGPEDRRGNKWKDLVEVATLDGKTVLVEAAYDEALAVRDMVHRNAWINAILTQGDGVNEASGYAADPVTGELRRVRPDRYRRDLRVMIDVKSTESAAAEKFKRSVTAYGYHAQEAFYTDVWQDLGQPVDGFVFIAFEKKSPYAVQVFELPPAIVEEGRAIMRKALDTYAECHRKNAWPGYADGVQELGGFERWQYRETPAPNPADEQPAYQPEEESTADEAEA